ncbi:hypothetical protein HJB82_15515 [Rhizobium sp. NZLR10]|uniref:hypothetical protein n=1 Tax=Rhizobium sp. NZLR10 TaxID=2731097 RepID=UPI001C82A83D|nr:hypothetical protein [Rhizobium sp. NZLR10]MBX5196710.1 hypothetical protein [Rhizobium sp. NZLR10]
MAMNMNGHQIGRLRAALANLKTVRIEGQPPYGVDSLSEVIDRHDLVEASIDFVKLTATGFTSDGVKAIAALARSFRDPDSQLSHQASNPTLSKFIASEIMRRWHSSDVTMIETSELQELAPSVEAWFARFNQVKQHVVPCILFLQQVPPIKIGPVLFFHAYDFPTEEFGITPQEFWPSLGEGETVANAAVRPGGFYFERLLEIAFRRDANWLAIVDVPGRADPESQRSADAAADIALGAIQLICPGKDMRKIARTTGRSASTYRADVYRSPNGVSTPVANHTPALSRSPEMIDLHLQNSKPMLESMGRRLEGFLGATSNSYNLDAAWCNAVYWYHEALAEDLETVAAVKLETAIEVLFGAGNNKESTSRMLQGIEGILGLRKDHQIEPGNPVTVKQVVAAISTARSRVLHGTWPTLHNDLPGSGGTFSLSLSDIELIARNLLLFYPIYLESYQAKGQIDDTAKAFLDWIVSQRRSAISAATSKL